MEDDLDIMELMDEFYDASTELDELNFDIPDVDIEYEEQTDEGCEGGACKI